MGVRDSSLAAYRGLPLQQRERDVMTACHRHFPLPARFTRKQLAEAMGWEINRITGRVLTLLERGYLTEYPQTRDGGHLLSIASPKQPAPAPVTLAGSVNPPAGTPPAQTLPVAAAPYEQLIYDDMGRPFYTAVGWGPGWPADQDHLHRRGR